MILSRFHWLWEIFTFSVKIGQYLFQLIHLSVTRTRFRQDGQLLRIGEILPIPDREMMKYNLNKVLTETVHPEKTQWHCTLTVVWNP